MQLILEKVYPLLSIPKGHEGNNSRQCERKHQYHRHCKPEVTPHNPRLSVGHHRAKLVLSQGFGIATGRQPSHDMQHDNGAITVNNISIAVFRLNTVHQYRTSERSNRIAANPSREASRPPKGNRLRSEINLNSSADPRGFADKWSSGSTGSGPIKLLCRINTP